MKHHAPQFWSAEMDSSTPSIDVHGLRLAEALEDIEVFLDRQLMSKYAVVKIIHGFGTGALRDGVRAWLKNQRYVAAFQDSSQSFENGAVTYVLLK